MLHSADFLLNRKKLARNGKKMIKGYEFREEDYEDSIAEAKNMLADKKSISGNLRAAELRHTRFFRTHGADGIILLSAVPIKNYDIGKIRAYEKEMVKNGILSPKGGLTKKGIRLIKEKMPKGEILRFRRQQEMERRKAVNAV